MNASHVLFSISIKNVYMCTQEDQARSFKREFIRSKNLLKAVIFCATSLRGFTIYKKNLDTHLYFYIYKRGVRGYVYRVVSFYWFYMEASHLSNENSPGFEHSARPWLFPSPVFCTCICGSGTRFWPESRKTDMFEILLIMRGIPWWCK